LKDEALAIVAEIRFGILAAEGQLTNCTKMSLAGFRDGAGGRPMYGASENRRRDRNRDGGKNG
jgi:hypothetical protein